MTIGGGGGGLATPSPGTPSGPKKTQQQGEDAERSKKNRVVWKRKEPRSYGRGRKQDLLKGGVKPEQPEQPANQKSRVLQKKGDLHYLSPRPWFSVFSPFFFWFLGPFFMRILFSSGFSGLGPFFMRTLVIVVFVCLKGQS